MFFDLADSRRSTQYSNRLEFYDLHRPDHLVKKSRDKPFGLSLEESSVTSFQKFLLEQVCHADNSQFLDSKFLDKISEHDAYILISLAKAVSEPHLSQPVEGLLNKFLITPYVSLRDVKQDL